jgi:integrase
VRAGQPIRVTVQLENSAKPRVRPKTLVSYQQLTEHHILPALGRIQLPKLTPQHVQDLLNGIVASGLSANSARLVRAVLRRALNQALKWGLVGRNVAALVDPPRVALKQVEPFEVDDILQLLKAFEGARGGALSSSP